LGGLKIKGYKEGTLFLSLRAFLGLTHTAENLNSVLSYSLPTSPALADGVKYSLAEAEIPQSS
jgi:hypothetical protein